MMTIKSLNKYIRLLALTTVAGILGSCQDDSIVSGTDFTVSGMDVTLKLAVDFPKMEVQTRADLPDHDLNNVQSLWIATFNSQTGAMTTDGWQNTDQVPNTDDTHVPHTVSIDTKSGPSYIVAVANVGSNYGVTKDNPTATPRLLRDLLNEVVDWEDFLNIAVVSPSTQNLLNAPDTPLPMAGAYTNVMNGNHTPVITSLGQWQDENFKSYTIPATDDGEYTFPDGAIHMRRLVSHVTFNLIPTSGLTITPHSFTVVNVPKYSWLYERRGTRTDVNGLSISNYGANFGDACTQENCNEIYYADPIEFPSYNITATGNNGAYTFNFWQSENKHSSAVTITEGEEVGYDERDKQKTEDLVNPGTGNSQTVTNTGLFTSLTGESWTPNNMASYVMINCSVDYGDNRIDVDDNGAALGNPDDPDNPVGGNNNVQRTGEATYIIHLGYMGLDANDFNCYRNADYTYNVTINGVNDIRVEAFHGDETPGVEGMVSDVVNDARIHDAHYEKYNIQLDDSELAAWDPSTGKGFGFILTTYDNLATDGSVKTYTEESFINRSFDDLTAAEKRYVDWVELKPTTGADVLAEYTPRGAAGSTTFNLVDASKGNANKSTSHYYTVFVKEYTYDALGSDPADETWRYNGSPIWHSYVGASPRRYYIRVTKAVSADGQSIYARSKYAGVQQSIATYYVQNASTTSTNGTLTAGSAIGVEHINESFGLNLRRTFEVAKDRNNGRYNCWLFTGYRYNNGSWVSHNRNSTDYGWNYYLDRTDPQTIGAFSGNGNQDQTMSLPRINNLVGYENIRTWNSDTYQYDYTERNEYSPQPNSATGDDYIEAISACLNRNRDNNGDGLIQANEMRWYVPAIGKYLRLLIGQESLTPNKIVDYSTLGPRPQGYDNSQWGEFLFYSSDDWVLWGMEGCSTSEYNTRSTQPWQVRCIRNLGTNLTGTDSSNPIQQVDQTIPAYQYNSATGVVSMDYYPLTAMRTTAYTGNGTGETQMPVHTIAQGYNSIYRYGFQVHPETGNTEYDGTMTASNTQQSQSSSGWNPRVTTTTYSAWTWENMITYINTSPTDHENPCTELNTNGVSGWRLPNIKELAIMKNLGIITDGNAPYLSCSIGVIAGGNGQRLENVTDAPTDNGGVRQIVTSTQNGETTETSNNDNTHNFMSTAEDGRITQAWRGTYRIRCVRDYTGGN